MVLTCLSTSSCQFFDDDDDDDPNGTEDTNNTVKTNIIGFEDVKLGSNGYINSDTTVSPTVEVSGAKVYEGVIKSSIGLFENEYTVDGSFTSWKGFSCSSLADTSVMPNFNNEMYLYGQTGANNTKQFGIAYGNGATITFENSVSLKSVEVCNTTYTYKTIRDGSLYNDAFSSGSWFKVVFKGYDSNENLVGEKEFFLADYREGNSYLCDKWTNVDLSALDGVNKVIINFDSSDKTDDQINTPTYVAIDNLEYK